MLKENTPSAPTKLMIIALLALAAASAILNIFKGIAPSPEGFFIAIAGLVLFLVAKLSLILKGRTVSFGTAHMSNGFANLYRVGYWLMIVGIMCTFAGPGA